MENERLTSGNYRYPGVTPFTTGQANVFFGRQQDTDDLYRLIRREQLVVLYGKSGLGKSSLLNAGIIPRCKEEGEYSPIVVRFGSYTEGNTNSPLSKVIFSLRGFVLGAGEGSLMGYKEPDGKIALLGGLSEDSETLEKIKPENENSLWHHAKTRQLNEGGRPLLLFDQFEELFSYPEAEVAAFQRELSELMNTGIPLRFRRRLETAGDPLLTEEEEDLLETPLDARIVFAIRSDRMHLLDRLKDHLPNVLRHCFELKALTKDDARDAILLPARAEGDFQTPTFDYTPAATTQLLAFLEDEQDKRVEGILLQMLCEHFERRLVEAQGFTLLDLPQIGDPNDVVQHYYEEKITALPPTNRLPARRLIEDGLVSEGEAMRLTLHESYIRQEFGVDKTLLEQLVDSRLLRSEPFLRGGYTYELSHDRLVPPVLNARSMRREWDAQEEAARRKWARARQLEEAQRQAEIERRKKRRAQMLAAAATVLAILALAAGTWAWQQKKEAQQSLCRALDEQQRRYSAEVAQLQEDAEIFRRAGESLNEAFKRSQADSIASLRNQTLEKMKPCTNK